MTSKFVLFQHVTLIGDKGTPVAILSVTRVMKRFIELSDESRWTLDGYPYPRQAYPGMHLVPTAPEHRSQANARRARRKLERVQWDGVRDEVVLKIWETLKGE